MPPSQMSHTAFIYKDYVTLICKASEIPYAAIHHTTFTSHFHLRLISTRPRDGIPRSQSTCSSSQPKALLSECLSFEFRAGLYPRLWSSDLFFILIVVVAFTIFVFVPLLTLQALGPYSETGQESHKCDSTEDSPGKCLPFWLYMCGEGEETARQEGSNGTSER